MARAGRLRHRVKILKPNRTADGFGGNTDTPDDVATVWAQVSQLSGTEAVVAGALTGERVYEVKIRYREGISPDHTLDWRGTILEIRGTTADELNHMLTLTCFERRAEAPPDED